MTKLLVLHTHNGEHTFNVRDIPQILHDAYQAALDH